MIQYTESQLAAAIETEAQAWAIFFGVRGDEGLEARKLVMRANVSIGYLDPLLPYLASARLALKRQAAKRQAYDIVFRLTLTGCDWHARLWLRSESDAFEAMYFRCSSYRLSNGEYRRHNRDWFRVVSCEVSPDQSRRCTL